jgi:tripartite-type tricarboxylate transporter receptor subunit TctC
MSGLSRRSLMRGAPIALFAAASSAVVAPAVAQTAAEPKTPQPAWPSGTIRIIVPFPPGGSVDAIARLVQPGLQQRLGASVIIENKPGASGIAGTAAAAKSPPDGNTWLLVFDTHAVNPSLVDSLPFDTRKDLDPVLLIATAPYVLAANPARPFTSLGDVVAAAKAKPDSITYASVGTGSVGHLAMVQLGNRAGMRLVHVPYRGGGPAMNDAIAGHVDLIIGSSALIMPQLNAGTLRALAQTGRTRLPGLDTIPTVADGGFADFEAMTWWGAFAPAGTPAPIVARFAAELTAALREERVTRQLTESQPMTLQLAGAEDLRRFVDDQLRTWGAVIRENGIKGDP